MIELLRAMMGRIEGIEVSRNICEHMLCVLREPGEQLPHRRSDALRQ
jgi:hypothetical protein